MTESIFLLAKNGNQDATEQVIRSIEPFIIQQCRRVHLRIHDFEDLKQICYEAVIKGIPKIRKENLESAPSYLMKCVHNALKYEARRILAQPSDLSLESEDSDGIRYGEKLVAEDDTEETIIRNHDRQLIKEAFQELCTEEKNVVSYFIQDHYGGLKRYSDLYKVDYRKARYLKDKALRKMRLYLEAQDEQLSSNS
ncbi:sigma-70 family RNA polymerase sigma factor [Proteiniclasticum sp. BAD-10]|uniref:Sigma-70 family RNA polymerase sigma factor n=1 Tax=Proteiniclasticum sediminis TaxID=2804028 RepID=A0A941CMV8_9CLOT|nr:sigma-70 family RNA polymerase sigma factor [Proteiniclasticum sediminis]MBR0575600.1 sigma-70 family RNA polymerase sigma factor [Proteiniclasticum sediminis]